MIQPPDGRRSALWLLAALLFPVVALAQGVTPTTSRANPADPDLSKDVASFEIVWRTVRDKHWDPKHGGVDWTAIGEEFRAKVAKAQSRDEVRGLINEMLGRLGQSHFGVFPPVDEDEEEETEDESPASDAAGDSESKPSSRPSEDEAPEESEDEGSNGIPGFGLTIIDDAAYVAALDPEGPAEKAGVKLGWKVVKIGSRTLDRLLKRRTGDLGEKLNDDFLARFVISQRMSGTAGRGKTFVFEDHDGQTREMKIKLGSPRGRLSDFGHLKDMEVLFESRRIGDVGYVYLSSFFDPKHVLNDFRDAVLSFRDCKGLIIDVRGNPGGMGMMAAAMARFIFNEEAVLGRMHRKGMNFKFFVNPNPETFDGRVALLTDGASASTSEIFAGGLKDLGRARLFGSRTAGMALPSVIESLPNGDNFQYAVADCETPSGAKLEGDGVSPHVEVKHTRESLRQGKDAVIEAALEWLRSNPEGDSQ